MPISPPSQYSLIGFAVRSDCDVYGEGSSRGGYTARARTALSCHAGYKEGVALGALSYRLSGAER